METISKGAEAVIRADGDTVVKDRVEKRYRHRALDDRLRRGRTDREARLLAKAAQAGVAVPSVEAVEGTTLTVEHVDGTPLRDCLDDALDVCRDVGAAVARLHSADIIHGDLTTSNMLLHDGTVHIIDFGLGFFSDRVEDRATDLHLLEEVLDSTHTAVADEAMQLVVAGYRETTADADAVLDRLTDVAARGRYR